MDGNGQGKGWGETVDTTNVFHIVRGRRRGESMAPYLLTLVQISTGHPFQLGAGGAPESWVEGHGRFLTPSSFFHRFFSSKTNAQKFLAKVGGLRVVLCFFAGRNGCLGNGQDG
jgi:hypothetical protein